MSEIFTEKPGVTLGEVFHAEWAAAQRRFMHEPLEWDALSPTEQGSVEAGAQGVANAAIRRRTDELDAQAAPVSPDLSCTRCGDGKPEAAKVIVVTEANGKERRYAADEFAFGLFGLAVTSGEKVVARYTLGAYLSAREEAATLPGTEAPDPNFIQGKKLAIALDALRAVNERFISDDLDEDLCRVLNKIACDAFEQITDVDL